MDDERSATAPAPGEPLAPVPGPIGREVLLFEFLVLAEYWLAPLLFGVTNFAGEWSLIGNLLFATLVATVVVTIVLPLRRPLATALSTGRRRLLFHGLWAGSLVTGLIATSVLQSEPAGAAGGWINAGTVYSPFGAWPAVAYGVPSLHFLVTLNLPIVVMLGFLAIIWASAVSIGVARRAAECAVPRVGPSGWRQRLVSVAALGPLGFMTGCSYCPPLYIAGLALVAPDLATQTYASVPLTPWIGFTGLLYLASLGLSTYLLARATARPASNPAPAARLE